MNLHLQTGGGSEKLAPRWSAIQFGIATSYVYNASCIRTNQVITKVTSISFFASQTPKGSTDWKLSTMSQVSVSNIKERAFSKEIDTSAH